MKPLVHAKLSVKKYGGVPEDYLKIHNFIDQSKMCMPDIRHRALLHSAFGCYLAEQMFGVYITNSDGKDVSVRDIAEEHVIQDLGFIPSVEKWLNEIPIQPWMSGAMKKTVMKFDRPNAEPIFAPAITPAPTVPNPEFLDVRTHPVQPIQLPLDPTKPVYFD